MRDLGINMEVFEKAFDRLEQFDERVVDEIYAIGRLIDLDVTKIRNWELKKVQTVSRIARPASIAFAGGNGYKKNVRRGTCHERVLIYQADSLAERGSGREGE